MYHLCDLLRKHVFGLYCNLKGVSIKLCAFHSTLSLLDSFREWAQAGRGRGAMRSCPSRSAQGFPRGLKPRSLQQKYVLLQGGGRTHFNSGEYHIIFVHFPMLWLKRLKMGGVSLVCCHRARCPALWIFVTWVVGDTVSIPPFNAPLRGFHAATNVLTIQGQF